MFCASCGRQIPDNSTLCPYCNNSTANVSAYSNNQDYSKNSNYSGYSNYVGNSNNVNTSNSFSSNNSQFVSPNEQLVSVLKNGTLDNIITGEGFKKEQAILSTERIYYRHKNGIINLKSTIEIVDVKDITGTKISSVMFLGSLIAGIIFILISFAIFALINSPIGIFFLAYGIAAIIIYFATFKKYFIISYAGGNIKFSVRGYSMNTIERFQKEIHSVKSKL